MARPRVPRAKADLTGYSVKHKERFRGTNRPPTYSDPVGEPPYWLDGNAQDAWIEFADNLPWLNHSHRGIVSIASLLAGRLRGGTLTDSGANLLRLCLGQMGATPADFTKVNWSPSAEENEGSEYFR